MDVIRNAGFNQPAQLCRRDRVNLDGAAFKPLAS